MVSSTTNSKGKKEHETNQSASPLVEVTDNVLLGISKKQKEHPDSKGYLSRFFVTQSGLLKVYRKICCLYPDRLVFLDLTGKIVKMEIKYSDIISITSKNEKSEFVIEYKLPKNKKGKETYASTHREYILSTLHRLIAYMKGQETKYHVSKWSKDNTNKDCLISLCGATLIRIDSATQKPLQIKNLIDIKEIVRIKEKPSSFVIFYHRSARFHCFNYTEADELLGSLNKAAKEYIGLKDIPINESEESEIVRLRDKSRILKEEGGYIFTCTVDKVKNEESMLTRRRKLACTKNYLVDLDHDSGSVLAIHSLTNMVAIIRYGDNDKLFGIDYKHDRVYKYMADEREMVIANILEICSRSDLHIPISHEEVLEGIKEGRKGHLPHHEYADLLIKKLNSLEKEKEDEIFRILREFNMSFGLGQITVNLAKDKAPIRNIFHVLNKLDMLKLKDEDYQTILGAMRRILFSKASYEDVPTHKEKIQKLLEQMVTHKNYCVRIAISSVICESINNHSKNEKSETSNQMVVLSSANIASLIKFIESEYKNPESTLIIKDILCCFKIALDSLLVQAVCDELVQSLFNIRSILYSLCRSKTLSIAYNASFLLVALNCRCSNEKAEQIQQEVLLNSTLLYHIYLALFSPWPAQREMSVEFIDVMASYCEESILFMKRLVPEPLLAVLNENTERTVVEKKEKRSILKSLSKAALKASKMNVSTQNWGEVVKRMQENFENALVIWNEKTRQDLKSTILFHLKTFAESEKQYNGKPIVWNYEEFTVDYKSLEDEIRAGKYFVKYLSFGLDTSQIKISNPLALIKELYYKVLLELDNDVRILCAKALNHVYVTFLAPKNVEFPFLDHLITSIEKGEYTKDLTIEILHLLDSAINVWCNADKINQKCLPLVIAHLRDIHCEKYGSESQRQEIASVCLNILNRICAFRTNKLAKGQILRPFPISIQQLSNETNLPHVVQALLFPNVHVRSKALTLLNHLFAVHDLLAPNAHKTGVFYFLLSNIEYENNETAVENIPNEQDPKESNSTQKPVPLFTEYMAKMIKHLNRILKFIPEDYGYSSIEDDEFRDCYMRIFFPDALLPSILENTPESFTEVFNSNICSPKVIWNKKMRLHLQNQVRNHIKGFIEELNSNQTSIYEFKPIQRIIYEETDQLIYVGRHYLKILIDPDYKDFVIEKPGKLFDDILIAFSKETQTEKLLVMIRSQILLLGRLKPQVPKYTAMNSCMKILTDNIQGQTNLELCEGVIRLLYLVTSVDHNREQFMRVKGHEVLLLFLKALYGKYSTTTFDGELDATRLMLQSIYRGLIGILNTLSQNTETQALLSLDPDFGGIIMKLLFYSKSLLLFKNITNFLASSSSNQNMIKKFWSLGIPLFLLQILLKETDPVFVSQSALLLTVLVASNMKQSDEADRFTLHHMESILPAKICSQLTVEYDTKSNMLVKLLLNETMLPDLIWTKDSIAQLQKYLDEKCALILNANFNSNVTVTYDPLTYTSSLHEIQVAGIYVRIYNQSNFSNWPIRDERIFLTELVHCIAAAETQPLQNTEICLETIVTLLSRTTELNGIVTHCLAVHKSVNTLFRLLRLDKSKMSTASYIHLLKIIRIGTDNGSFLDKVIGNEVFGDLTCSLRFGVSADEDKECKILEASLDLIEKYVANCKLALESLRNGIFLYLVSLFCGIFRVKDSLRTKSSLILGSINKNSNEQCLAICRKFIPKMLAEMIINKPNDSVMFFEQLHKKPNVQWNDRMRRELRIYLIEQLKEFDQKLQASESVEWKIPDGFKLLYSETKDEMQVCDIFVTFYNRDPKFKIPDPAEFLIGLLKLLEGESNSEKQHDILEAVYNVLRSNPELAKHGIFSQTMATLLKLFQNESSHYMILLDIFYRLSIHNQEAMQRMSLESIAISLFSKIPLSNDMAEMVLIVILSFVTYSPQVVKQVLDGKKDEELIELVKNAPSKEVKIKAAYVLQILSQSKEELRLKLQESEFWSSYANLIPPGSTYHPLAINNYLRGLKPVLQETDEITSQPESQQMESFIPTAPVAVSASRMSSFRNAPSTTPAKTNYVTPPIQVTASVAPTLTSNPSISSPPPPTKSIPESVNVHNPVPVPKEQNSREAAALSLPPPPSLTPKIESPQSCTKQAMPPPPPKASSTPLSPPPAPPLPTSQVSSKTPPPPPPVATNSSGGPPPPPPPPPSLPPSKPSGGSGATSKNALLDSIRAGKKLKKVSESEKKYSETDPKKQATPASSSNSREKGSVPSGGPGGSVDPLQAAIMASMKRRQNKT